MTQWRCLVATAEGRSSWTVIEAEDRSQVVSRLSAAGLMPLRIDSGRPGLVELLNRPIQIGRSLSLGEQSLILTQLATLVNAGLPVDRSIDLLRDQASRVAQRDLLARILTRVRSGGSLGAAFEETKAFPNYVIGVIRAAERGGQLGKALQSISERLTLAAATRQQLISALTYPAAVLVATIGALILVLTMVVPQFEPIFQGEEARLPHLTQAVLALSSGVRNNLSMVMLVVLSPLVGITLFLRSKAGGDAVERHRKLIPGLMLRDQYIAGIFIGLLSTMLSNGVPVVMALSLSQGSVSSRRWKRHIATAEQEVREGTRLSTALGRRQLLPSTAVRLIEVGEQSGQLAQTCAHASEVLVSAARARIDRIIALANPIAIVTLGGLIALLVSGVMLGIFALGDFAT